MAAAVTDKSYNRLFIVTTHSEVIYPREQKSLPVNMTVATLSKLNQSINLKGGQIPTQMFSSLFSQFSKPDSLVSHTLPQHVLPTESKIREVLSSMSTIGIVYATHHGQQEMCEFRQRKDQAEMTVQMCFLPGVFVHSAIYEFSPIHETGMDVSDVILGPKDNPSMQLYRETSDKDRAIIEIEKIIRDESKKIAPDDLIIERSSGDISQEDINQLRENRERYKSAIQFGDSINEFCAHDIEDVEKLREEILRLVITHDTSRLDQLKWVNIYHKDKQSTDETLRQVFLALKRYAMSGGIIIPVGNLARILIHNVLTSIYHYKSHSDYKLVTTGHEPIRSDTLFNKIREHSGDNVYVVFIGCRHVPSTNPMELAVIQSPRSAIGSVTDFMGGRKLRRRSVNKPKTRKISKRIHKKIITNRSHRR